MPKRVWTCLSDDPESLEKDTDMLTGFLHMFAESGAGKMSAMGMLDSGGIGGGIILFNDPIADSTYGIALRRNADSSNAQANVYRLGDYVEELERLAEEE